MGWATFWATFLQKYMVTLWEMKEIHPSSPSAGLYLHCEQKEKKSITTGKISDINVCKET
jgi:hypothetical protein